MPKQVDYQPVLEASHLTPAPVVELPVAALLDASTGAFDAQTSIVAEALADMTPTSLEGHIENDGSSLHFETTLTGKLVSVIPNETAVPPVNGVMTDVEIIEAEPEDGNLDPSSAVQLSGTNLLSVSEHHNSIYENMGIDPWDDTPNARGVDIQWQGEPLKLVSRLSVDHYNGLINVWCSLDHSEEGNSVWADQSLDLEVVILSGMLQSAIDIYRATIDQARAPVAAYGLSMSSVINTARGLKGAGRAVSRGAQMRWKVGEVLSLEAGAHVDAQKVVQKLIKKDE